MADDTVRLVAVMEAQLRGFTKGMEQAAAEADRRFGQMERRMNQTERLFTGSFRNLSGLARQFGLSLSIASAVLFAKGIIEAADALKDTSDQLGITTQELQALNSAARDTGAGTDRMKQGLASLSDQLGDAAKGEGNLAKLMRDLKIPLGTTMQVFFDLADAVKNAATQNERMAISTLAFNKAGKELVPLLSQGAAGVRALFEEAQKKGQIWDPQTVASLDRLNDSFERLKVSLTGKIANPLAGFFEYIQGLTPAIDVLQDRLRRIEREPGGASRPSAARLRSQIGAINAQVPFRGTPLLPAPVARPVVPQSAADIKSAADEKERWERDMREAQNTFLKGWKITEEDAGSDWFDFLAGRVDRLQANSTRIIDAFELEKDAAKQINDAMMADYKEMWDRMVERAKDAADELKAKRKEEVDAADKIRDAFDLTGAAGVRAFENIGDALKQMLQQLAATAFQLNIMEPLLNSLLGKKGTPLGGAFAGGLGSFPGVSNGNIGTGFLGSLAGIFGFAGGGSPPVGIPSLVGERGPELFVPRVPGTIIPNGGMGASVTIVNHNSFAGAIDAKSMMAYADQASRVAAVQTIGHIKRNLPGMMITASQRNL